MALSFSETKIKSPDLAWTISNILYVYSATVADATEETSKRVANKAVKALRKAGRFKGGEVFRKGWSVKATRIRGLGGVYVIYNKTKPGLAHLLEFGHAIAGGGRTKPRTEAFNFIAPIADGLAEDFANTFVDVMDEMT